MSGVHHAERRAEDGTHYVKIDAGKSETDPTWYDDAWDLSGATTPFIYAQDANARLISGKSLQGIVIQVKGHVKGDRFDVQFVTDDVDETVVQNFGPVNAPMITDAAGWSKCEIRYPGASKEIPVGIKVQFVWLATDAVLREVLVDWLGHE